MANHFFVSKSRLNAIFRSETGCTVMEYVSVCRLKYAQQLLLNGFSAVEACQASGFGDYTAFYRAYVKYFKHQPKFDKREPVVKQAAQFQNTAPWFKMFRSFYDIHKDEQPPAEDNKWDRNKTVN
ncbi:MAG: AraC family transcriptional regulator, partial [Synergistes sp.]|nr:AraC family transcriptional regulator [Synergistes sp.]